MNLFRELKINTKLGLGYGIVIILAVIGVLVSFGSQLLVDRQISRTTSTSAQIDRLTDGISEKITTSQISLNEFVVQRALVGVPDSALPEEVIATLAALQTDAEALRLLTAGMQDANLLLLGAELDLLEEELSLLENRVAAMLADLETLGDEHTGQQGRLLAALAALTDRALETGSSEIQVAALLAADEARAMLVDGDPAHIGRFHSAVAAVRAVVGVSDLLSQPAKTDLEELSDAALQSFDEVLLLQLAFTTRYNAFLGDTAELHIRVALVHKRVDKRGVSM